MDSESWHKGTLAHRVLPDGRLLGVFPQIYTYRLTLSEAGDFYGYGKAWCYHDPDDAIRACREWDGEGDDPPHGWHREIGAPYRRREDGDPGREYINP